MMSFPHCLCLRFCANSKALVVAILLFEKCSMLPDWACSVGMRPVILYQLACANKSWFLVKHVAYHAWKATVDFIQSCA
jgi:hypothetical protein